MIRSADRRGVSVPCLAGRGRGWGRTRCRGCWWGGSRGRGGRRTVRCGGSWWRCRICCGTGGVGSTRRRMPTRTRALRMLLRMVRWMSWCRRVWWPRWRWRRRLASLTVFVTALTNTLIALFGAVLGSLLSWAYLRDTPAPETVVTYAQRVIVIDILLIATFFLVQGLLQRSNEENARQQESLDSMLFEGELQYNIVKDQLQAMRRDHEKTRAQRAARRGKMPSVILGPLKRIARFFGPLGIVVGRKDRTAAQPEGGGVS